MDASILNGDDEGRGISIEAADQGVAGIWYDEGKEDHADEVDDYDTPHERADGSSRRPSRMMDFALA